LGAGAAPAAGTAVVVTDRCGVAALLGETGAIVVSPEAGEIRDAIRRLLADPALRARLGEGGREAARRVSWDSVIEQQEELYRRAIG
jgi:glycosyltransferase involved in cell wall biosynthesis